MPDHILHSDDSVLAVTNAVLHRDPLSAMTESYSAIIDVINCKRRSAEHFFRAMSQKWQLLLGKAKG